MMAFGRRSSRTWTRSVRTRRSKCVFIVRVFTLSWKKKIFLTSHSRIFIHKRSSDPEWERLTDTEPKINLFEKKTILSYLQRDWTHLLILDIERAVFLLPFFENGVQIVTFSIRHKKAPDVVFGLVSNDLGNGFKIPSELAHTCTRQSWLRLKYRQQQSLIPHKYSYLDNL